MPRKVGAWYRQELLHLGLRAEEADRRVGDLVFAFEPGDLISETMSMGAPAPIEVVVSGRNLADSSTFMDRLRKEHAGKTGSEYHELSNLQAHLESGQALRTTAGTGTAVVVSSCSRISTLVSLCGSCRCAFS